MRVRLPDARHRDWRTLLELSVAQNLERDRHFGPAGPQLDALEEWNHYEFPSEYRKTKHQMA